MRPAPSILTNMAFHQSRTWREAVTSICTGEETPDDLCPWTQAFRLLRLRSQFDVVVTMGARPSLAYGLLCALLRRPSRQIMTEVFLDPAQPASVPWWAKTALFRWIARRSLGILTNSSAEVGFISRRFGIPEHKLRFVPMYSTLGGSEPAAENDGFVLSIGRTSRDWDTLLRAAPRFAAPLHLVAGSEDRLPLPLHPNVQIHRDLPLEEGHAMMRRATVVAIPLLPSERSTGQVVLFEAMALGKPVVATRATGIADYVRDGENGLLVEPGDADALAAAVNRLLQDSALARRLAAAALADIQTRYAVDTHANRKLQAIRELMDAPASENPNGSKRQHE